MWEKWALAAFAVLASAGVGFIGWLVSGRLEHSSRLVRLEADADGMKDNLARVERSHDELRRSVEKGFAEQIRAQTETKEAILAKISELERREAANHGPPKPEGG